jgi:Putative flagellar system-associated repeat
VSRRARQTSAAAELPRQARDPLRAAGHLGAAARGGAAPRRLPAAAGAGRARRGGARRAGGGRSSADIANTDNATTGISYTATRTSPSPITCTNKAFWTNPFGSGFGLASQNPTGRPDSPPLFNTLSEADAGSNDVLLQFDQEMLDSGLGIPATNRFQVTGDGVDRAVTAVAIINDSLPDLAILDLTFDGAALTSGQSVTVRYSRPLTSGQATLRDLENNQTPSFGPVTVPVL